MAKKLIGFIILAICGYATYKVMETNHVTITGPEDVTKVFGTYGPKLWLPALGGIIGLFMMFHQKE